MAITAGRLDLSLIALGALATIGLSVVTAGSRGPLPFLAFVGLAAFGAAVLAFVLAPHVAVAASIPFFAVLPTLKTLYFPVIGATKDGIVVAAVAAAAIVAVTNTRRGRGSGIDARVGVALAGLFALYVLNLGSGFARESFDAGWMHGIRLAALPLLLLVVGLVLGNSRVLRWAIASLIVTGLAVAAYGVWQQLVGQWRLVEMGYSFEREVRTINGHLRSFGTLDEPFAYAGFLLFCLAAVAFGLRRRQLALLCGSVLAIGVAASLVRSTLLVALALAGLWLAARGRALISVFLIGGATAAALAFLVLLPGATVEQNLRVDESTVLTLNGRTDAWSVVFEEPSDVPLGKGVGEVGTAAARAEASLFRGEVESGAAAVDSGYFATVADVGLVGLLLLLFLVGRLAAMAVRAAKAGRYEGWLALAMLMVLLIDATTRSSFTAFPTAFIGFLMIGLALRSARDQLAARHVPALP